MYSEQLTSLWNKSSQNGSRVYGPLMMTCLTKITTNIYEKLNIHGPCVPSSQEMDRAHSTAPKAHIRQPTMRSLSSTTVQYTITAQTTAVPESTQPNSHCTNVMTAWQTSSQYCYFGGTSNTKPASVNGDDEYYYYISINIIPIPIVSQALAVTPSTVEYAHAGSTKSVVVSKVHWK